MLLSKLDAILSTHGITIAAKAHRLALGRVLMTGLLQGFRPEHTGVKKNNYVMLKARLAETFQAYGFDPARMKGAVNDLSALWGDAELCEYDRVFLCYVKHKLNGGASRREAILEAINKGLPDKGKLTPAQRREIRELAESYIDHGCFFPTHDRVERMADFVRVCYLKRLCLTDVMKGITPHYERKLRFFTRATGTPAELLIGTEFFTKVMRNFYAVVAFGNDDKHVVQYPKSAAQSALQDDIKRLTHPEESRVAGHNSEMLKGTSISMASREVAATDLYVGEAYSLTNPLDNVAVVNAEGEDLNRLALKQLVHKSDATQRRFLALMGGLPCPRFTEWGRKKYKAKGDNSDWREQWSNERYLRAVAEFMGIWLEKAKRFLRAVANALCVTVPKFAL